LLIRIAAYYYGAMTEPKDATREERSRMAAILGKRGGTTTAKRMTREERRESARRAARARWAKQKEGKQ
jgi:hypothetical protein